MDEFAANGNTNELMRMFASLSLLIYTYNIPYIVVYVYIPLDVCAVRNLTETFSL